MSSRPAPPDARPATLSTWDSVSVIVGIVIGAGIYETPPLIFGSVPSGAWAMVAWAIGGLLCLNGAFTYAELASTYPRSGGDYVYLTRAFGSWLGFLFGWAQISVIITGSIGMMAYVFAGYAAAIFDLGAEWPLWLALASVVVLSVTNLYGVAFGKHVQNVLSAAKLLGIAAVVVAGLLVSRPVDAEVPQVVTETVDGGVEWAAFASALVLVFLTYGGWNDAAFFVGEMGDRRMILRALAIGILLITAVYLLMNAAFLQALGWQGVRDSRAIAADAMRAAVGDWGARGVALLVSISALGAVNGLIFAGSRVYAAVGEDHRLFAALARKSPRFGSPVWSLVVQAAVTVTMIVLVGTAAGQQGLNDLFTRLGLEQVDWVGKGGFDTLLRCTAPIFWLFFSLTSVSLFVLRWREPDIERPFRTPLFPFCPLLFSATCGYMLYGGLQYAGSLAWVGVCLLAIGLPVYGLSRLAGSRRRAA